MKNFRELSDYFFNINHGGQREVLGFVPTRNGHYPIYSLIVKSQNPDAKNVFLSGGIHGDESAGTAALLRFLNHDAHSYSKFNFYALPCMNPFGFDAKIRFNAQKIDINRDFWRFKTYEARFARNFLSGKQFAFAINLHEDDPSYKLDKKTVCPTDFYVYELSNHLFLGHALIDHLKRQGTEISSQQEIYGDKNVRGVVNLDWNDSFHEDNNTLEDFLQYHTNHIIVPETSMSKDFESRVFTHIHTIKFLLGEYAKLV